MLVYDAMSTAVVTVTPEQSAAEAAQRLVRQDVTGLPVIDHGDNLVGVISEIDLLRALRRGVNLELVQVSALMNPRPLFVEPALDLDTAIDLMDDWQVRRLPVCYEGRLLGIISRGDILAARLSRAGIEPALYPNSMLAAGQ